MHLSRTKTACGAVLALSLGFGCAGTQKLGQTSANGPENEPAEKSSAAVSSAADPLAAGSKATKPQAEKREITDDQQDAFDKVVTKWQKARRDGTLKNDCGAIAGDFGGIADEHPSLLEARGNQAAVLYECGRQDEANRIWEKLAGGPKPYAPALAQLGYAAWQSGDAARAETLFQRSIDADKQLGSVSARLNLAEILHERARKTSDPEKTRLNKEVLEHLRTVLAVDGNNLQAYAAFCSFYYDEGLYEMARLVAKQAIWRAEEIATGKYVGTRDKLAADENKGAPAKGKGKKGAAVAADAPKGNDDLPAAQGTGYTPDMKRALGEVYNTQGLVWIKRKDVSQAISSFKKAIEMDPAQQEARMNLAALSLNYRDYPTAEENFREVLKSEPKNYDAAIGLGVALRGNKKFDEAEAQYTTAQKLDPQNPASYFNLGLLYQEYKGSEKPNLLKAQQFYRDFISHANSDKKRREAEKRIKDIDDTIAALEEAAKMQKEADEMQKKMEEQQKKMEEDMKKMQDQEKAQPAPGAGASPAAAPTAAATAPAKGAK